MTAFNQTLNEMETLDEKGGMREENIICFAKDWSEDPTANNHVMRELSKRNRVLWLNSIAARSPNLTNKRDIHKIFSKLKKFMQGPKQVDESLWVYTPIVLPFPYNPLAVAVNKWILKVTLKTVRRKLGMRRFQLWSFLPNVADYVGIFGEDLFVYYCTDNYSKLPGVDTARLKAIERNLCRKADIIFTTARSLAEERKPFNSEVHVATHGVDYAFFSKALDPNLSIPEDAANLPRPIVGFYGLLEEWLDYDLIQYLAERHPDWTFVFIGRACVDLSRFDSFKNIHFLGRKPYEELPNYCSVFDVGLIPFKINELTVHVNPLKLKEYLSAGIPSLSTDLPEAHYYPDCFVAKSYEEFEERIQWILKTDTHEDRKQRSDTMKVETWEKKIEEICRNVMNVLSKKNGAV